eukprot:TRINITY_DN3183_c3_g5_i1.p1 TRINITY_DN3183_c3_g5~~TRINITY_DN3183_c3_g5_i1.p1  ORF type:complete len:102 (-),score=3.31 TRINITY_DN3183_c3_g5_i1:287-592(-)
MNNIDKEPSGENRKQIIHLVERFEENPVLSEDFPDGEVFALYHSSYRRFFLQFQGIILTFLESTTLKLMNMCLKRSMYVHGVSILVQTPTVGCWWSKSNNS